MSLVTENQPHGTPTWIDLAIPDLERAMGFYGALFGWEFQVGPPETMHYTHCLLGGRRVAALAQNPDPAATARVTDAGGSIAMAPTATRSAGSWASRGRRPRPGRPPSRSPTPTPPWPGPPRPAAAPVRPRTSSTAAWPPSPTPSAPSSR